MVMQDGVLHSEGTRAKSEPFLTMRDPSTHRDAAVMATVLTAQAQLLARGMESQR
jgi:hypothetical protein